MTKPKVIIFGQYFRPAYLAGGSAQSLSNLVDHLHADLDIAVVCRDRDLGVATPFDLPRNQWYDDGQCRIWYETLSWRSPLHFLRLLRAERWDMIYANSYHNLYFSFVVRLLARLGLAKGNPHVVLAPRGEFARNAIAMGAARKTWYRRISGWLGLHHRVTWQASGQHEADDVAKHIPAAIGRTAIVPDLTPRADADALPPPAEKQAGSLRLVMVARIAPIKNVRFAIEVLRGVTHNVRFDLYGPLEDPAYWAECEAVIATLPANVRVAWHGPIGRTELTARLAEAHAFLMPTFGENFGHSIFEALQAGLPVMISDQTLWRDLAAQHAGHDLPLANSAAYTAAIEDWAAMGGNEFAAWREGAKARAARWLDSADTVGANRRLLTPGAKP